MKQMSEELIARMESAKVFMELWSNYVNGSGSEARTEGFILAFKSQHPYLQMDMFKIFLELVEAMAGADYQVDPRNESCKEVSVRLLAGFRKEMKDYYMATGSSEVRAEEYSSGNGAKPSRYVA